MIAGSSRRRSRRCRSARWSSARSQPPIARRSRAVAGTWRYEDGSVRMSPFGRLDRATRSALGEEAERLAAFHAG